MSRIGIPFLINLGSYCFAFTLSSQLPFGVQIHRHACYEFSCAPNIEITALFENEVFNMNKGDFLITPPKYAHTTIKTNDDFNTDDLRYIVFMNVERIDNDTSNNMVSEEVDRLVNVLSNLNNKIILHDDRLQRIIITLFEEANDESRSDILICGRLTQLLACISEQLSVKNSVSHSLNPDERRSSIIDEFFNHRQPKFEDKSPESLASQLGVSVRHLNRILQKMYDKSYSDLMNESRMNCANYFLEKTGMSVAEIADKLGYKSESAFFAAYKRNFGTTPHKYRQTVRKKKE